MVMTAAILQTAQVWHLTAQTGGVTSTLSAKRTMTQHNAKAAVESSHQKAIQNSVMPSAEPNTACMHAISRPGCSAR